MKKFLLPENGQFYKANLHCHSIVSDGKRTPEEIKQIYMEKGYAIVAYTDRGVLVLLELVIVVGTALLAVYDYCLVIAIIAPTIQGIAVVLIVISVDTLVLQTID